MEMATFLAISKHAPDKCPMFNETTKRVYEKWYNSVAENYRKHGVKLIGGWTVHGEHLNFWVVDAPSLEALQALMMEPDILALSAIETMEFKVAMNMEEVAKMMQLGK
jgi:uncharacterized protein with GYD domain